MPFAPSLVFFTAMSLVESGGNQYAVRCDDCGNLHYGLLQISASLVEDVNRVQAAMARRKGIHNKRYVFSQMLKTEPSREVFAIYLGHYCTRERCGHEPTEKDAALIWRYGPTGYKSARGGLDADRYWSRVESLMMAERELVAEARV